LNLDPDKRKSKIRNLIFRMLEHFRFLLWPLSLLYNCIIKLRNLLFDHNILASEKFSTPIISVGNLKVGGTSKTPCVIYLNELFQQTRSIAVLSRGYGRKSRGFYEVNDSGNVNRLGDEPMLIKNKCSNVKVFVDENRRRGIKKICSLYNDVDLILLDDAFQHRYVLSDLYILLTVYNDLYIDDKVLPFGRLRESASGAERAHIVIVTKCPETLTQAQSEEIKKRLNLDNSKSVFFSSIEYSEPIDLFSYDSFVKNKHDSMVLVSGISTNSNFFEIAKQQHNVRDEVSFKDHVSYDESMLKKLINNIETGEAIMTTEKDGVKLKCFKGLFVKHNIAVYVLPIKMKILFNEEKDFKDLVSEKINNKI
jgi:tetraacyldisaccharide 4'-kinase